MPKCFLVLLLFFFVIQSPAASFANEEINVKSIEEAGFENVSKILEQMSPEQLKEVVRQAESMLPELEDMSQQEIDNFTNELLEIDTSIDSNAINVKKLDPNKSKDLKGVKKDIKKYKHESLK